MGLLEDYVEWMIKILLCSMWYLSVEDLVVCELIVLLLCMFDVVLLFGDVVEVEYVDVLCSNFVWFYVE